MWITWLYYRSGSRETHHRDKVRKDKDSLRKHEDDRKSSRSYGSSRTERDREREEKAEIKRRELRKERMEKERQRRLKVFLFRIYNKFLLSMQSKALYRFRNSVLVVVVIIIVHKNVGFLFLKIFV